MWENCDHELATLQLLFLGGRILGRTRIPKVLRSVPFDYLVTRGARQAALSQNAPIVVPGPFTRLLITESDIEETS